MIVEIPGKPQAKQRPRLGRWGAYTPAPTQAYETKIKSIVRKMGIKPVSGPISVEITCEFPIPTSWNKARRLAAEGKPHVCVPDLDNVVKCVLDGLNKVAIDDDAQVHTITARKIRTSDCGEGRTIVKISGS